MSAAQNTAFSIIRVCLYIKNPIILCNVAYFSLQRCNSSSLFSESERSDKNSERSVLLHPAAGVSDPVQIQVPSFSAGHKRLSYGWLGELLM